MDTEPFIELARRVASLRNSIGRIDLTNSATRCEVYSLVVLADELLKTANPAPRSPNENLR